MNPQSNSKLLQIANREIEFYDKVYAESELRIIEEPLRIRGLPDLQKKRVLICGCGIGVEAIRAARAGGDVYAFDISPVAIERTRHLASLNGVALAASRMDFHHLDYPDDFFDVAHGRYILHHVDCELAGRELFRVMKPGGIAQFIENSDANPLIMWIRRQLFGGASVNHRQRFLFVKRKGSVDEDPLSRDEVAALGMIFGGNIRVEPTGLLFFRLVAGHVWNNPVVHKITSSIDHVIGTAVPSVKRYSFNQSIWLQKPDAQDRR